MGLGYNQGSNYHADFDVKVALMVQKLELQKKKMFSLSLILDKFFFF